MTERDQQPGPAPPAQSWTPDWSSYGQPGWNSSAPPATAPIVQHALTISLDPMLIGLLRQSLPGQPPPDADPLAELINAGVATILERLAAMSETSQQHADALAAQLMAMDTALKDGVTAINAEIAALKSASPNVDFTALDAAVGALGTDVAAAAAIPGTPATPPPAQPAPPVTP